MNMLTRNEIMNEIKELADFEIMMACAYHMADNDLEVTINNRFPTVLIKNQNE